MLSRRAPFNIVSRHERQVWLASDQVETALADCKMWAPDAETGGLLLGYVADDGDRVITRITTSGPNAVHGRDRFVPDYDFDDATIDSIFQQSAGLAQYLGDWHSHPRSDGF